MTGGLTGVVIPLIIALAGLTAAAAALIGLFRKVAAVHVLVNSQLSAMMTRVEQLTGVLQGAGLDVPGRIADGPPPSAGP